MGRDVSICVVLIAMIEDHYRSTFFDTVTSSGYTKKYFLTEKREEQRFLTFAFYEAKWRAEIGEKGKE